MAEVARGVDGSSRRRMWGNYLAFLSVLAVIGTGYWKSHRAFESKLSEIKMQESMHDWKSLVASADNVALQKGVLSKEKYIAFLERYAGNAQELKVSQIQGANSTSLKATFAADEIGDDLISGAPGITFNSTLLVNPFLVVPPSSKTTSQYDMAFVAVALHEFPGTERFDPHHWSAVKSPNRSKNYTPSQYLFAIREKRNLDAMHMPTYWDGNYTSHSWDDFISSLRAGLVRDRWDVNALLKAYNLTD